MAQPMPFTRWAMPGSREEFDQVWPQPSLPIPPDPALGQAQQQRIMQMLQALGTPQDMMPGANVLGPAYMPGFVSAPTMQAPDYTAARAAMELAKPKTIAAPQYQTTDYSVADKFWEEGRPPTFSEDDYSNAKWGSILSGALQGFQGANNHKLLAAIIGGLGGYGESLGTRAKMRQEEGRALADYSRQRAGYEGSKAQDLSGIANQQAGAQFMADRVNQSSIEDWARALGGLEKSAAENVAEAANKTKELGFRAQLENRDAQAMRAPKILGTYQGNVIYQFIDKNGNMVVDTKPAADFKSVNGRAGGTMARDPGMAGMETLIDTLRAGGALRSLVTDEQGELDPAYTAAMQRIYGTHGAMTELGEGGRKEALSRSIAEENAWWARFFKNNPDKLERALNAVMGGQ